MDENASALSQTEFQTYHGRVESIPETETELVQARHVPGVPWLPLFTFFVLVVYPLSTGPMIKLVEKGIVPPEVIYIYSPVGFAVEHSTVLRNFFNWYVGSIWQVSL
jgi:hypothetical protein